MKKPRPAEQRRIDRFIKSEFEKVNGPWPEGMTIKEVWQMLAINNEAREAFHAVIAKASGTLPSEIKKADHDPDWSFFWGIGAASNRDLEIEWVKNRLLKAIEQNDLKFFVRLPRFRAW